MRLFSRFSSVKLRSKILIGILLSLVPMLAITGIAYYTARSTTLKNSERIMHLINEYGANQINRFMMIQEGVFAGWSREETFGLATQLLMTGELQDQFESMLQAAHAFCLLMLTDIDGKVLAASAGGEAAAQRVADFQGQRVKDVPQLKDQADLCATYTKSAFMDQIGQKSSYTYLFSLKTRDTNGEPNGFFLAYLDWSLLQDTIETVFADNVVNGFGHAKVALLDMDSETFLCHSNEELIGRRSKMDDSLRSWLNRQWAGEVQKFRVEKENDYVTFTALQSTAGLLMDYGTASNLRLVTLIPEGDIMVDVHKLLLTSIGIGTAGCLTIALIAAFFLSDIRRKFNKFLGVFEHMSQGEIRETLDIEGNDEFAEAAISFNRLVEYLREVVSVCEGVAVGEYDRSIRGKGENDLLGNAINRMTTTLREATEEQAKQNWLKTGLSELNDQLRGERDIPALAQNVIAFLAEYLDVKIGALYLADEKNELQLVGTYAYTKRKNASNRIQFGQGLVGQAALERKHILITNAPDDYITIHSGLGESPPRNILVMPFLYEGKTRGVIELGALDEFSDGHISFLENVVENVAIGFNTAQSRFQTEELLKKTQTQAETLQRQQEELRASNEELEAQTILLKESEARLQAQQEELRQANEELEEKTKALQKQKGEVEKKNVELTKARETIEEKARDLAVTSKYKSEFLANMSHELRTPLNSLLILSKLLTDNGEGNLSQKEVEFAETIHSAGSELLHLINDILDLSKVEAGKMELNVEDVDLSDFVDALQRGFAHIAEQKGVGLSVAVGDGLPRTIRSDLQRIQQIVKNFLSNAFKFTDRGEVSVNVCRPGPDVELSSSGLDRGSTIAIAVSDTGKGIAADKVDLIFEAFQQEDGTTSRKYGGTGLGLSVSKELAKFLGGEIQLLSLEGEGSTFILYLPETLEIDKGADPSRETGGTKRRVEQEKKPLASEHKSHRLEAIRDDRRNITAEDKSVLIVEDDPNFAKILFDLAHQKGFKCVVAGDGETGLHFADHYRPSAIILDIGLPGMDGWGVMERLKGNLATRHIPVHFVSAHDRAPEAMKMGAIGYIVKPVEMDKIHEAFRRIEHSISGQVKRLLVVQHDESESAAIVELVGSRGIETSVVGTGQEAYALLESERFDCMILDLHLPDVSRFELLERIKKDSAMADMPVVIYTAEELSEEDETTLKEYSKSMILKGTVKSPEGLLDEVSLFLHMVAADMPEEKRERLTMMYDKDAVLKGKKILVVDDDMRNVFALTHILEEKGSRVVIGKNGKEGLEQLNTNGDTDLVLMDIMMPEMDGYEAMQEIRKERRFANLPIIALTAKAMKGDRNKCIEAGASDYMAKPVDTDKLLSLLRVWLYDERQV
ncbi:MAG: response regulator [Thermodesulfobacteriota bacterium]|nr:response regulator [Thermodesulfobacteriota bacterium]